MRFLFLLILVSQWLIGFTFAEMSRIEQTQSLLQSIQNRIEQATVDIGNSSSKAEILKQDLLQLNDELGKIENRVKRQRAERDTIAKDVKKSKEQIEMLQERIARQKPLLNRRLRSLYQSERVGPVALFFSEKKLHQKISEYSFLAQVAKNDRRLIDGYNADRAAAVKEKSALDALLKDEEQILSSIEQERREQSRAKLLKKRLLQTIKRENIELTELVGDLQKREKELGKLLKILMEQQSQVQQLKPFPSSKGKLNLPIAGEVVVTFGRQKNKDLKTSYESRGWMIESAGKTENSWNVESIWDGSVAYIGNLASYGNMVIVNHGDSYYSLYAQLADITTTLGASVKRGERVGKLRVLPGERLYFEIRNHGTPLNPDEWVKGRSR